MKNRIKKLVTVLLSLILLVSLSQTALAITNSVTILSPYSGGYFIRNSSFSHQIVADITGTPQIVKFDYVGGTSASPIYGDKGYLNSTGGSRYSYTWSPNQWIKPIYQSAEWIMPTIQIRTSFGSMVDTKKIPGYITYDSLSAYRDTDPNFMYYSYYVNNFRGVGTDYTTGEDGQINTYNCLAYVLGINYCWVMPWKMIPSPSTVEGYMKQYGYTKVGLNDRPEIIYYTKYNDVHFARVSQWNSSNIPTEIFSKWGASELIKSDGYSPFAEYTPVLYFKRTSNLMTNSIQWNEDTKSFYDSSFFEYDSKSKIFKDKVVKNNLDDIKDKFKITSSTSYNLTEEKDKWLLTNENSTKTLNKALVKYIKEYKKNSSPFSSFYFRDKDKALSILTDLGTKYIPEMLNEISLGNPWSSRLIAAIEIISDVEVTQEINITSQEGRDKWIENFKMKYNSKN